MAISTGDAGTAPVRRLPTAGGAAGYDRIPPHNLDAEVSVLGGMLLSRDAIAEVSELLGPEDFYRGAHRTVFEACRDLYDRGEPVDAVTVADELDHRGRLDDVGGALAVTELVKRTPTAANALYYARIVADHALRRRLIDAGTQITGLGYDPANGVAEAVDSAESVVFAVAQHRRGASEFSDMKALLRESFKLIEKRSESRSSVTGLATGFLDFDELTAGLQPGNLVIIAARPAMGKCLAKGTEVLDPVTGALHTIGDLVARGDGHGTAVASLGADFRLRPATPSAFLDNGVQPVVRVRTRLGRSLVATAEHPLLTLDGWLPVSALRPGDRIASPRALPYFGTDPITEAEAAVLAFLIGDGNLGDATPGYSTTSHVLLEDIQRWAEQLGVSVRPVGASAGGYRLVTRRGQPNPLTARLRAHGLMGTRADTKFVPDAIFRAPRGRVALFLNRLFACDGSVYVGRGYAQVTYTSISERLITGVQHLLLRFGVIAKRRRLPRAVYDGTGKAAWELQVTDAQSVRAFAQHIGVLGKQDKLEAAVALLESRRGHTNVDLVPEQVCEHVRAVKGDRPWTELSLATGRPANHNWHLGRRSPSRQLLGEIADHYDDAVLHSLATSDIYWDEIVAIEPAGRERVYDLTVPGNHNFVAADLIVHNSTLVTNIAAHVTVELRRPTIMFSLEMTQMELVQRLLAAQARIDSKHLKTGDLRDADWSKLAQAMGQLSDAPLFLDETGGINLMEIRTKCRRLKQRHGLDLVIVDYLQLMQSHRRVENRVQEVSEISRGLKVLAGELNVPVVALSQLSRNPENRAVGDKRPQLSDLRESGSIEQDADLVCFIYRDEVYDPDSPAKGEAELIVAKNRNGPQSTVRLSFIGHHSRFANMARGAPPPGVL